MKLYDNDEYRDEFMELVYSLLHSDGTNDRANQIIDAFDAAPSVEAELLPPNDPLTLEELRKMDGEPVWVECMENHVLSCWGYHDEDGVNGYCAFFNDDEYGKTWLAYRRKTDGIA